MNNINYKKWNSILGWATFVIALITYTLTLEPTVSYWDCGEYISTAVKLEVGHPPGAPLFQMLGAFFAMFTSDVTQIAKMVNFMSALASAFTILFLFWTITMLAEKIVGKSKELTYGKSIAILGSGLVGALAFTFSDSFWFSAVEGEVYAMSSFLMALLFWLGLHWGNEMDSPRGHKWLLLISFVVGLSFGVHILSLLVIPSIVFIYFYKRYKNINSKKFIIANVLAVLVLAFVFKFLFPYTLSFFSASELFFVNSVGLPFNSGSIIAGIILIAAFYFTIRYTRNKKLVHTNLIILCLLFIMIGFSSWLMLPIRANANTTINENNPSSARELLAYYNREQYGDASIFYDSYYSETREQDPNDPYRDDKPKYEKDLKLGKYVIVNNYKDALPNYTNKHKGFIPRMVDPSPSVVANYKAIAGIPQKSKRRPTFGENIKFMFQYQFGYMYGRYFMWNFVGRQDDIQGNLDTHGNWLSGINFIDELRLGSQSNLPEEIKNNKGRNTYFFLPFILGIIGLLYHLKLDKKNFYILLLFFAFTGLAIIFYTNPKPFEPRERDYAVVGSFYVFAIWIGLGVLALFERFKEKINPKSLAMGLTGICLLAVPALMASQNWDDHDRSGRYATRNNAKAYLDSCQENAIMFTIGDNDTFPLWYMQEVENYRTDIKLINTSLFATDWYIDQQKRKTYEADPIPSQLTHEQYRTGSLDVAYHIPNPILKDTVMDIKSFMNWIGSNDERTQIDLDEDGIPEKYYPTNKLRIPVDKEAVLRNKIVPLKDSAQIVPYIDIVIDRLGLAKNRILMLDILANNNWERPIYFTGGAHADEEYIWLKDYLQLDGLAYKFVPIRTPSTNEDGRSKSVLDLGRIDTDIMYHNVKKWDWKNSDSNAIYVDVETRKNGISFRNNLIRLAEELVKEEKFDMAEEILDLSINKMPIERYGHFGLVLGYVDNYYRVNNKEKARKVANSLVNIFQDRIEYYSGLDNYDVSQHFDDIEATLLMYNNVVGTADEYDKEFADELKKGYVASFKLLESVIE
jgi:MFS family permease